MSDLELGRGWPALTQTCSELPRVHDRETHFLRVRRFDTRIQLESFSLERCIDRSWVDYTHCVVRGSGDLCQPGEAHFNMFELSKANESPLQGAADRKEGEREDYSEFSQEY